MAGWKSALGALGLTGKGEPVAFEFTLYVRSLAPWPSDRPLRRLALRWTRGSKRHGNTRAVHPLLPDEDAPEDAPLTYEFREQLNVPATLYKAKGGNGRAHPGFQAKPLLLTLLEVDQSGRGADEVGTITLNLAEFANAGMGTPHERALLVSLKPGVNMGATGAPELALAVACRMAGSAAGPPPASSLADSDAGRDEAFEVDEDMEMYTRGAVAPPDSHNMRGDVPPPLPPRSPSPPPRMPSAPLPAHGEPPASARSPSPMMPPPPSPLGRSQSMPPPRSSSPPLPPKPTYLAAQAAAPPQLPPRPVSPVRPASPTRALPPLPSPAVDALAAEVERLRDELARSQEALARETARSKQLSEAAAGAQFKYDLLVDMYTLQMLDQDIMQAKLEGHDEPSFARAGITV